MDEIPWQIIIIALVFIFPILIIVVIFRFLVKALKKLGKPGGQNRDVVAVQMGFQHSPVIDYDIIEPLDNFELFSGKRNRMASNLLEGEWNGVPWKIFDYQYLETMGDSESTNHCTVAFTYLKDLNIPGFYMAKEYIWHRMGNFMGKDINFDN